MLDLLKEAGRDVIAVGKIFDIFDGQGVTEKIKTTGNTNGIAFTKALQTRDFEGLCSATRFLRNSDRIIEKK